jgi:hypothetical protein
MTVHNPKKDECPSWSQLITKRNDYALQVLETMLKESNVQSVALLYGSSHCPDLHHKLVHTMGFSPSQSTWRTAWSVCGNNKANNNNNSLGDDSKTNNHNNHVRGTALSISVFLALYLIVGALDWINVLGDVVMALDNAKYLDAGIESILYLVRHVLLYLGMSKFLVDWTTSSSSISSYDVMTH